MKNIKLYLVELLLFIFVIVFNIFIRNNYILNGLIIAIAIFCYIAFGYRKDNSYIKGSVIRIVIACLLSYFVITYSSGLLLGFNRTIFTMSANYFVKIVLFDFVAIVSEEIIRYIIWNKSINSKMPLIIFTIIMCVLNIITEINGMTFSDRELIFIFISVTVLPVISRELLCSYLTCKVSPIPSIIFKSVIVLYELILPIIPSLGNYLYSVFNIFLPYFIYYFSSKSVAYAEKSKKYSVRVSNRIVYVPILIVLLVIILLVSGILKYKMIAIGSSSMAPAYERGDAVIYEKEIDINSLKLGDIIAFRKSDVVITHRINDIINSNGNLKFKTKGDNNNSVDYFEVLPSEVLGKVEYRIQYIGYPTLWINEYFRGGEINYEQ